MKGALHFCRKPEEKDNLGDLGVDMKITLKWNLKIMYDRVDGIC
jgi:hypothetical protein